MANDINFTKRMDRKFTILHIDGWLGKKYKLILLWAESQSRFTRILVRGEKIVVKCMGNY